MKWLIIVLLLLVAGCGSDFAGGFAGGVATMKVLAEDSQEKFIAAVNELNAETARINEAVGDIDGTIVIRPETIKAVESLKGREKDPVTWFALVSVLANAFLGGKAVGKKKEIPVS